MGPFAARQIGSALRHRHCVEHISLGANFVQVLGNSVGNCDAFLVLIGPSWLDASNGTPHLENPDDVVRIEIGAALKLGIPVIPIWVEAGHRQLKDDQLPDDLKKLAKCQGFPYRQPSASSDASWIIKQLKDQFNKGCINLDAWSFHGAKKICHSKEGLFPARRWAG